MPVVRAKTHSVPAARAKARSGPAARAKVRTLPAARAKARTVLAARAKARSGPIEIVWSGVRRCVPDAAIARAVRASREHGGRPDLAASIVFVSDRTLARMHGRHLGDGTATDVITFDLSDDLGGPLVELYVSADRARQVAARRRVPRARELSLYVVHGVLHACGFDDRSTADRAHMRAAEAAVLSRLGYAADRAPHDA